MLGNINPELLYAGFWIFLFGVVVVSRDVPISIALVIVILKVAIPLVYFNLSSFDRWTLLDDQTYFAWGAAFLAWGYGPISLFTHPLGLATAVYIAGGESIGYYWWNLLAVSVFGVNYFAPVMLNVGTTFMAGFFFVRILRVMGFSTRYAKIALVFYLLHWETISWSSFVNVKDNLVLMLTLMAWFFMVRIIRKFTVQDLLGFIVPCMVIFYIRFYVPMLILISVCLFHVLSMKRRGWIAILPIAIVVLAFAYLSPYFNLSDLIHYLSPSQILVGAIRFPLTPQPWSIDPAYSYLFLASVLHWLFFIPATFSFFRLWRSSIQNRAILMYLVVVTFFYAIAPAEVMGPRERVQINYIYIWLQFDFLWTFTLWAKDWWAFRRARLKLANGSLE